MTGVGLPRVTFDAPALYAAVQRAREEAGWSWRDLEAALQVRSATARRLRRSPLDVDHDAEVLLRLATLTGRSLESYVPGAAPGLVLDRPPSAIRVGGSTVLAALDGRRVELGLSWRQAAAELGVGVRTLERVARGGRLRLHLLLRSSQWLDCSVAELVERSERSDRSVAPVSGPGGR